MRSIWQFVAGSPDGYAVIALPRALFLALSISMALPAVAQSVATPASAIEQAMAQNGQAGKVIAVREKNSDDGATYFEVKILTNGKVRIFKINKQ